VTESPRSRDGSGTGEPDPGYPRRRPTAEPNRFLIPNDQLPRGFAERLDVDSTGEIAKPRPAATLVLVRDAPAGPEALLLRRHRSSGFAADAWVFPGGVVDDTDRAPALSVLCDGPSPEEWAEILGVEEAGEALGYLATAIREAFEETGILLARPTVTAGAPSAVPLDDPEVERYRAALLRGEIGLREMAAEAGLTFSLDQLVYVAHWITPEPEPRRYDTRFFLAPVPDGAVCRLHEDELVEARWIAPREAVERFETGELNMLPPTVETLRRLSGHGSVANMQERLRDAAVPTILPRMRRHPDGVVIEFDDA